MEEFVRLTDGSMLPSIIAHLILVSIVDPIKLGIDADGFMLGLSVARLGLTGIDVDPPVLTHADFVGNVEGRIPGDALHGQYQSAKADVWNRMRPVFLGASNTR